MRRATMGATGFALLLCGACSSTSKGGASVACGAGVDACLTVGIGNADPAGYQSGSVSDGKGSAYLALVDVCPTIQNTQYKFVSDVATVKNVDLTTSKSYSAQLGVIFADARFSTTYKEGDTVALTGFLDDDGNVTAPSNSAPSLGDSIFNCIQVKLVKGSSQIALPLAPCIIDKAPPYFFKQAALLVDCSTFGGPSDAGAD